jgi:zona occludens toxin
LTIDTSQVTAIGFFPVLDDQSVYDPNTPSIVLPGDLVILDEAWRWWSTDSKIPDQHMAFWREHRHFVGGKGDTCDLIVISQSVSDLHRKLRSVIELTTICSKPKELGITSAYMCDVYSRATLKRGDYLGTHRYKYDKKIFALYKSYSGTVPGKENILDKRQNVLGKAGNSNRRGCSRPVVVDLVNLLLYHSKLQSGTPNAAPQNQTPQAQAPTGVNPPPSTPVHQPIASSPQSLLSPSANANPRAVGYIRVDGQMVVVLETPEGRFRFADNVDTYRITSHAINVDIDGAKLVPWSGGVKGK